MKFRRDDKMHPNCVMLIITRLYQFSPPPKWPYTKKQLLTKLQSGLEGNDKLRCHNKMASKLGNVENRKFGICIFENVVALQKAIINEMAKRTRE